LQGTRSNVNLPNIGTASARAESPFNKDQDVKASYKLIATTDEVLTSAASKMGMNKSQFGKPRIEVLDGTALMNFEINGATAEEAKRKALALQEAFQERLAQLREMQAKEQEIGFENSLSVARRKLESSQRRLSDYKVRSGLVSKDQIDQLANGIEALRRLKAETSSQQQDLGNRALQLSQNLQVSSGIASDIFKLNSDAIFQESLKAYSEAEASYASVTSRFGPNHPLVQSETAKRTFAQVALVNRGREVLGYPIDLSILSRLNPEQKSSGGGAREELLRTMVINESEQRGLAARAQELDRQINQLEARLADMAQRGATLEALNRDMEIADAVFSSNLASLDASKADIFGAYPPVQLVAEPSRPSEPTSPQRRMLFLGAAAASALVSTALFLLWLRKTSLVRNMLHKRKTTGLV
jgi:uncharacterized protein involved in exopolysaccharide biosynthesis